MGEISLVTALIVIPIFWWHRRQAKRLKDNEIGGIVKKIMKPGNISDR